MLVLVSPPLGRPKWAAPVLRRTGNVCLWTCVPEQMQRGPPECRPLRTSGGGGLGASGLGHSGCKFAGPVRSRLDGGQGTPVAGLGIDVPMCQWHVGKVGPSAVAGSGMSCAYGTAGGCALEPEWRVRCALGPPAATAPPWSNRHGHGHHPPPLNTQQVRQIATATRQLRFTPPPPFPAHPRCPVAVSTDAGR